MIRKKHFDITEVYQTKECPFKHNVKMVLNYFLNVSTIFSKTSSLIVKQFYSHFSDIRTLLPPFST
jgi:hypothetical protein